MRWFRCVLLRILFTFCFDWRKLRFNHVYAPRPIFIPSFSGSLLFKLVVFSLINVCTCDVCRLEYPMWKRIRYIMVFVGIELCFQKSVLCLFCEPFELFSGNAWTGCTFVTCIMTPRRRAVRVKNCLISSNIIMKVCSSLGSCGHYFTDREHDIFRHDYQMKLRRLKSNCCLMLSVGSRRVISGTTIPSCATGWSHFFADSMMTLWQDKFNESHCLTDKWTVRTVKLLRNSSILMGAMSSWDRWNSIII